MWKLRCIKCDQFPKSSTLSAHGAKFTYTSMSDMLDGSRDVRCVRWCNHVADGKELIY